MKKHEKSKKKKGGQGFLSKNMMILALGIVVIGGISIYATQKSGNGTSASADYGEPELPDFAYTSSVSLKTYNIALAIPEVLERIPCYCGCVDMAHLGVKHKHLRDCFIFDDGTFDDHASYCDLCMHIALEVYAWHEEGMPLKEIRTKIDAKYGGGKYGPPTDTPEVI